MPVIASSYRAPVGLGGGHAQTIWASVIRRIAPVAMQRERMETPDGDFLDLDVAVHATAPRRIAILTHGLEGHSRRRYMQGMARALIRRGWSVAAWNCRGCSGEPNRLLRSYHSGATEDLDAVVRHLVRTRRPEELALVGFSLGGNMTLKLLGEYGDAAPAELRRAVVFSVPCDLASSAARLARWDNRVYMRRFLRTLVQALREKDRRFPEALDLADADAMRTFAEFDERYTAPLHGFVNARDYWARCSSRRFIPGIRIPTLIVNARNDPFLTPQCFPVAETESNPVVFLELPRSGGHVGFVTFGSDEYWSERRAARFLDETRLPCTERTTAASA